MLAPPMKAFSPAPVSTSAQVIALGKLVDLCDELQHQRAIERVQLATIVEREKSEGALRTLLDAEADARGRGRRHVS
jgi:hypothetical protein